MNILQLHVFARAFCSIDKPIMNEYLWKRSAEKSKRAIKYGYLICLSDMIRKKTKNVCVILKIKIKKQQHLSLISSTIYKKMIKKLSEVQFQFKKSAMEVKYMPYVCNLAFVRTHYSVAYHVKNFSRNVLSSSIGSLLATSLSNICTSHQIFKDKSDYLPFFNHCCH